MDIRGNLELNQEQNKLFDKIEQHALDILELEENFNGYGENICSEKLMNKGMQFLEDFLKLFPKSELTNIISMTDIHF